jgi:uncharacterized protein (DUF1330 family)
MAEPDRDAAGDLLLCVMLWARPGQEQALSDYEDRVLELLPRHGAQVLSRVRSLEGGPCEVQLLRFPSEQSLADYMADPVRDHASEQRERAIARTEVLPVEQVGA